MYKINYPAIFVAALVHWILGAFWFSPLLFSKPWLAAYGMSMEQTEKMPAPIGGYIISFLAPLLTAYVLALVIRYANVLTAIGGAGVGSMLGAGLVAAENLPHTVFSQLGGNPHSITAYYIENGYAIVGCILMGAILGAWKKRAAEPRSSAAGA